MTMNIRSSIFKYAVARTLWLKCTLFSPFFENWLKKWICFLYPATLKNVGYYVISSVRKLTFECPSVHQRFRFYSLPGV